MIAEELLIQIKTEVNKAVSDIKRVEKETKSMGQTAGKVFKTVGKLALGLGIAFAGMSMKAIQAFKEQEAAETKLNGAIRATGKEAEISLSSMKEFASGLQDVTTYGDESTLAAAGMLQSLADLDEKGLKQVIPGIQDLATGMGMDLTMAASLVGKTLGSTTNALSRYGIQIDMEGTKEEKLAELTEQLSKKFGGLSQQMAQTRTGQLTQLGNSFGDLMEKIGEVELASVSFANKFVKAGIDAADAMVEFASSAEGIEIISDTIGKVAGTFAVIGTTVGPPVKALFKGLGGIWKTVTKESDKLFKSTDKGSGSMNALAIISQMVASVLNVTSKVVATIATNIFNFANIVKESADIVGSFFDALFHPMDAGKWETLGKQVEEAGGAVDNFVKGLVVGTADLVNTIVNEVETFGERTKETATDIEIAYTTTYTNISKEVKDSLEKIGDDSDELHNDIKQDLTEIAEKYKGMGVAGGQGYKDINESAQILVKTQEEIIKQVEEWADHFDTVISSIDSAMNQYYENQINRIENEELTEEEKAEKLKKMKEKQWRWQKVASIGESIINTATAVTKALSAAIPPFNFILAGIVGAAGAIQTALIAAQPMPSFAFGGSMKTSGPQLFMAGDNPSGVETITVSNPETGGGSPGIYRAEINGEVLVRFIQSKIDDGSIRLERAS